MFQPYRLVSILWLHIDILQLQIYDIRYRLALAYLPASPSSYLDLPAVHFRQLT